MIDETFLGTRVGAERFDDWDESKHKRVGSGASEGGRFTDGGPEAEAAHAKALESFPRDLIYPNEPPPNAYHAEERAILARAIALPERSRFDMQTDERANRKTEEESKEESRTFQAMNLDQITSVGLFTNGYDFSMRRLEEGVDIQTVTALTEKHWKEAAETGARPPATNHATPAEHAAAAQDAVKHIEAMFRDVPPSPGVVYRGMHVPPVVAEKILNSGSFSLDSMSSFTNEPRVARGFTNEHDNPRTDAIMPSGVQIMMRVEHHSGVNIASASQNRGEREVLLPKGVKFQITNVTREPPTTDGSYAGRLRSRHDGPVIWIDARETR